MVYLHEILQGFGAEQASSTRIFEDNQACIAMSENTVHRDTNVLAAHWCTQILFAGARRRQARQDHAVWHQRDGSRCTDEKPALSPFQNSQKHNARCHIATSKRLKDVGVAVLKRAEMNRDGGD